MDDAERKRLFENARQLEQRGMVDGAVRAYAECGAVEESARVLVGARRFRDAAEVLIDSLGLPRGVAMTERTLGSLAPASKKRAVSAGICFARANETETAIQIFLGVGETARAVELLRRMGDNVRAARVEAEFARAPQAPVVAPAPARPRDQALGYASTSAYQAQFAGPQAQSRASDTITLEGARALESDGKHELALRAYAHLRLYADAARMARVLGQPLNAAELFAQGSRFYESALCYREIGDTGKALDVITRVPRDDARYGDAAREAIDIAAAANALDFHLENFLSRYLDQEPATTADGEAFWRMAELYRRHDFIDNAQATLRRLLARYPHFPDARERFELNERENRGSNLVYEKILREDVEFRGDVLSQRRQKEAAQANLPELPDLPDLPDLPPLPGAAAEPAATRIVRAPAPDPRSAPRAPAPQPDAGRRPPPAGARAGATRVASSDRHRVDFDDMGLPSGQTMHRGDSDLDVKREAVSQSGSDSTRYGGGQTHPGSSAPSHPSGAARSFEPGSVVNGRYRFEKKLGEGGMAAVFKAYDLELEEHVAIKIFTQRIADPGMVQRFKQELSLSRRLAHPNVIRLYDIGSFEGLHFITMEVLEGKDLNHIMGKPHDLKTGLDWMIQTCRGLHAAHEQGVIHRDVKPHNIFLCNDGTIKVMDFGIAKRTSAPGMTVGNFVAGTPEYMSPEQIAGFSSVTHSTDLYAMGCVLYQVFTGKLPFEHAEMLPILVMHLNEQPKPPRQLRPDLPVQLEQIILKLLAKKPEERFASCAVLANSLEALSARM